MCILLLTTAHPTYPLILLSNRDEYLNRPTAVAQWWTSSDSDSSTLTNDILSGRDLRHPSQGTWLGITRSGRLAALTNFREESEDTSDTHPVAETSTPSQTARSRGEITKAFLTSTLEPAVWAEQFFQEQEKGVWGDMGGFSLLFGQIATSSTSQNGTVEKEKEKDVKVQLGILSNRTKNLHEVTWLVNAPPKPTPPSPITDADANANAAAKPTHLQVPPRTKPQKLPSSPTTSKTITTSLSNTHHADKSWPKTTFGELFLHELISPSPTTFTVSRQLVRDEILDACFHVLSSDTMPRRATGESWASYSRELRCSIFVGPIETGGSADGDKSVESSINGARKEKESSGKSVERVWYGTQKQTVLLVDWAGMATFVERTLEYEDGVRVHSGQAP